MAFAIDFHGISQEDSINTTKKDIPIHFTMSTLQIQKFALNLHIHRDLYAEKTVLHPLLLYMNLSREKKWPNFAPETRITRLHYEWHVQTFRQNQKAKHDDKE